MNEVRLEHVDFMLDYYYGHLVYYLTKQRYPLQKVPSRNEFINDYNQRAFYGN